MVTGGAASGGRGSFPLPFFENGKKCPNFGEKKCPDCVHFLLKMLFKEYRGEKTPTFFSVKTSFFMLQMKCLCKQPFFKKPPLP